VDNSATPVEAGSKEEDALRAAIDSEHAQTLVGCPALCYVRRPHEHVLLDGSEIAVDTRTDEVIEVRHYREGPRLDPLRTRGDDDPLH